MLFKTSILAATLGSIAASASPAPNNASRILKRDDHDFKNLCEVSTVASNDYYIVATWDFKPGIGGGGNPEITSDGAVVTFKRGCEQVEHADWTGGKGRLDPIKFDDKRYISMKMYNADFQNNDERVYYDSTRIHDENWDELDVGTTWECDDVYWKANGFTRTFIYVCGFHTDE